MSKDYLDWTVTKGPGAGLDMLGKALRKNLVDFDAFEGQNTFTAVALTDAYPLNQDEADAFLTTDYNAPTGSANAPLAYSRYILKARITGENSPHSFIPDPCDPAFAECPERAIPYVLMHTSFITDSESNMGDVEYITKGTQILVELSRNTYSYNLQFGRIIKVVNSQVVTNAQNQVVARDRCESLQNIFDNEETNDRPATTLASIGPRTVAAYEERYSYACRAAGPYDAQIRATAARLEVEPAVICAFRAVESGNLPATALRFEPHVFLRNRPDLAGQIPYTRADSPGGCPESRKGACVGKVSYQSTETGRAAFEHAFSLDAGIAVKSSSFGLFQIIGFNFPSSTVPAIANYRTDPQGFMNYMNADPVRFSFEILEAWFRATPRALEAAKTHDWLTLAKAYNGVLAAQQDYQLKLEAAYNVAATDCYGTTVAGLD